jgi:gas vesicle protein
MWRMMEALDLDKDTSDKIFEIRRSFLSRTKELNRSLDEDFRQLRQLLNESRGSENDKELANLIENIRKTRSQLSNLREEQYNEVSKILPVRKQAELVLFLKEFHNEIRTLIRRFQRRPGPHAEGRIGPDERPEFLPGGPAGGAFGGPPGSLPRARPSPPPGPPPGPRPLTHGESGSGGPNHQWEAAEDADDFTPGQ